MSNGLNKVQIIGNLGADPEIRYTREGGAPVASLSIATTDRWKDKVTGDMQKKTEWHRVSVFGRTAEIAEEFLKKGSKVYVEGKLQTNEKDGKYYTGIVANQMIMLDSKGDVDMDSPTSNTTVSKDEDKPEEGIPF